jgi:4-hydroxymandelate oxidase
MWRYVEAGAREGLTRDEALGGWNAVRFRPRVLRGVGAPDLGTELLGASVRTPIAVAPTSMQRVAHPDGELATAAGAAAAGALHVVSSNAGHRFADIAAAGRAVDPGSVWWLQAYLPPERELAAPVLVAAADAGAKAVVLTVDTPFPGTKYAAADAGWAGIDLSWHRCNFGDPAAERHHRALTPGDLRWITEVCALPVVVKGVLRGDDADACVGAGASAIWVSNHGGRQLDRSVSTVSALPDVVDAVGGRTQVYVDGGVRSGLDALAALALGADAVFVGRPVVHALASAGPDGVEGLLSTLTEELEEALELAGCARPSEARGVAHGRL